jgi:hypothetical protein
MGLSATPGPLSTESSTVTYLRGISNASPSTWTTLVGSWRADAGGTVKGAGVGWTAGGGLVEVVADEEASIGPVACPALTPVGRPKEHDAVANARPRVAATTADLTRGGAARTVMDLTVGRVEVSTGPSPCRACRSLRRPVLREVRALVGSPESDIL